MFGLFGYSQLSYTEFIEITEELKRALVMVHMPRLQANKAKSENDMLVEMHEIIEHSNTLLAVAVFEEIRRLGKEDEYNVIVSSGGNFKIKLKYWNKHIPNLKKFIVGSAEKIVLAQ